MQTEQILKDLNSQIEEKEAEATGLAQKLQASKNFIQQNDPQFFMLQGSLMELKALKIKLTKDSVNLPSDNTNK